jgi:flagellar hook-associated protein 1 FlgK
LLHPFNGLAQQLEQFQNAAVEQTKSGAAELSLMAKELASINSQILSSGQSGQTPNALLDLRDKTISEMSALAFNLSHLFWRWRCHSKFGVQWHGPPTR